MSESPRRAVVTGGAGFLGSHLCDLLLERGYDVLCLDNLLTGNTDNIAHLSGNPKFKFVKARRDRVHVCGRTSRRRAAFRVSRIAGRLPRDADPDAEGRIARNTQSSGIGEGKEGAIPAGKHVGGLWRSPGESATGNVLGQCQSHRAARRLRRGQAFAEAMTLAYRRYHGLDTRIVRIFNTYGPRMRPQDGRVVSNFIVQALQKKPLTIYGEGQQTRSFCYVSDLIRGIVALLEVEKSAETEMPFNIGNPEERTVRYLAELVLKLTGSSSPIVNGAFARGRSACPLPGHSTREGDFWDGSRSFSSSEASGRRSNTSRRSSLRDSRNRRRRIHRKPHSQGASQERLRTADLRQFLHRASRFSWATRSSSKAISPIRKA